MVKIIQKIVPASKYSIKCPYSMIPTGITKVYVKDETAQNWILNLGTNGRPSTWTTANVIIAGSSDDLRNN